MISSNDKMGGNVIMDVKTVFLNVLEAETAEDRQTYLDTVCANDSELRQQVDRLLDAHKNAKGFLDPEAFGSDMLEQSPFSESSETVIGLYTLLEKIGEGGMAVVYRAEQTQPIRRQVALKVIKLGMDTAEVVARFEAERQALAIMDHPNIAKVLDAGVTEVGKPYFAMELVRGISITDYCDQNKSNTQQRLELFMPVCNAVHHAHQKGIIHRDLKPSNILVTMRDNKPVPMIIDFGIAKAIDQRLTERTLLTLHTQLVGTPEYMSPEQADMGDMDIDTRTDIYSLGVVLYELMVGTSPFDAATLRRAAMGEIQRIIREDEPLRPSTRISAMGSEAKEIADRRGTNVAELAKRLNRELEWIPLKAMRKDRTRRYRSAAEFADDIGNYLSDRPLLAGPESLVYRFRKAMHKHRVHVLSISAVAAILITGIAVSMSLYAHVSNLRFLKEVDMLLSNVNRLYEEGQYESALGEIEAAPAKYLVDSVVLSRAQLSVEVGEFKRAEEELLQLTQAESQIAGVAHVLLARIYLMVDPTKVDKHRQLAESIRPDTAEAKYLRGMAAASADEALIWLDEAIDQDSKYFPARKAKVFALFSKKAFREMATEAHILTVLHPDDYMGYALRAIAHRETGQFVQALKDHAQAIGLCSTEDELPRLYEQRRVTRMRSGQYKEALEDSERIVALEGGIPDISTLLVLEQYGRIETLYKNVSKLGQRAVRGFKSIAEGCVFELLRAGHEISVPPEIYDRSPFYLMKQASELYARLEERAKPFSIPGALWMGDWSPDGESIVYCQFKAFSWLPGTLEGITSGINNRSVEIMNLSSGNTDQLARSGYSLTWSPDGKYIAFADHPFYSEDTNICVVPLTGGLPRKLAPGLLPNWSQDSRHIFFRAQNGDICSIDIDLQDALPIPVMATHPGRSYASFTLSPDNTLMVFRQDSKIVVLTFPEGNEVISWEMPWPLQGWNLQLQWHPDGKTFVLNSTSQHSQMGMCLFNVENAEMTHVLNVSRPWCRTTWSPDGSQLMLSPYAHDRWWLLDIDPTIPLTEALAPALTTEEFLAQRLEKWNQRIEADPLFADNYVSRAVVWMALKDLDRAEQDLDHCLTLIHESDDPAVHTINYWAPMYQMMGPDPEAQLWASLKAQLAEKFPEVDSLTE